MNTLITGHKGFIGSHFLKAYRQTFPQANDSITVDVADIKEGVDFVDITDREYDLVVHFAASVSVTDSVKNPVSVLKNNALKIEEFLANNLVRKFVLMSTVGVYPEYENIVESQAHWTNCKTPYSLSKYLAERAVIRKYNDGSMCEYVILRLSNVVGSGDRQNWSVLEHFEHDNPITVYGGEQTRDFVDVSVVVAAIMKSIVAGTNGVYTIASGQAVNILGVAKNYSEKRNVAINVLPARREEIEKQTFNITKARQDGLL